MKALGMTGISKSQVSRLCEELDAGVERFKSRRLCDEYPYVWLDATFLKVRQEGRVVSTAVVIAIAVTATGEREVLGLDVGPSEVGGFLAPVPSGPCVPGPERGSPGDQRLPPGLEGRGRGYTWRDLLAAVPGALHAQRSLPRSQGLGDDGGKLTSFYMVMGEYDYVGIGEAPSDEVQAAFMLGMLRERPEDIFPICAILNPAQPHSIFRNPFGDLYPYVTLGKRDERDEVDWRGRWHGSRTADVCIGAGVSPRDGT